MTPPALVAPRPRGQALVLRWLLVSLVLTGVIAMHVLSRHDAGGGHLGSMIDEPSAMAAVSAPDAHGGHGGVNLVAAPAVGAPIAMPALPGGGDLAMAACILFLVIGAGALLLALLVALRRRIRSSAARAAASRMTIAPRGPPLSGPPRMSLCVLRV